LATNWNNGLPTSSTIAHIDNGGTVTITKNGEVCSNLFLSPGTVNQTDGSLNWGWILSDWTGGSLKYNLSGGTLSGTEAYYSGTINQSGGSCSVMPDGKGNPTGLLIGGGRGPGYYNMTDGTLQASYISVGATAGGVGTMTISNSTGSGNTIVTVTGSNGISVGGGAPGTLDISGGTLQALAGPITLGASAKGMVNQTGGLIACTGLFFGRSYNGYATYTYNLDGGTLAVSFINLSSNATYAQCAFNFGGGTLKAGGAFSTSLPMTLTAAGGDAKVDTDSYSVTLSAQLSGPGGIEKLGEGALALSGANSYLGITTVDAGVLDLVGPNAWNPITNLGGAYLSGGELVFDYTGNADPYATILSLLNTKINGSAPLSVMDDTVNDRVTVLFAVPEPSTLLLAATGLLSLFSCAWQWREHRE
jgi:autotransporter-associated beta strand protein